MNTERTNVGWRFWLAWVLASVMGFVVDAVVGIYVAYGLFDRDGFDATLGMARSVENSRRIRASLLSRCFRAAARASAPVCARALPAIDKRPPTNNTAREIDIIVRGLGVTIVSRVKHTLPEKP